ncbi:MAG: hypothetical protein OEZ22_05420 [Spirochaetia bacterium]|nr:hypothetical protein [Spirochaetia bacterium]
MKNAIQNTARVLILPTLFLQAFSYLYAEPKLTGVFRNDTLILSKNKTGHFSDILENRLVLKNNSDKWKLYIDGRFYLYFGEITEQLGDYDAELMRSFIRYYAGWADFTLGKTYINLGNSGIFNPFEIDKTLNFSDVSYAKKGILAFESVIPLGDLSRLKAYGGYNDTFKNYSTGFDLGFNIKSFDLGLASIRNGTNKNEKIFIHMPEYISESRNIAGVYFKGDLELGIQAAYAHHFNDKIKHDFIEANFGFDYSFFGAMLLLNTIFYYNENGGSSPKNYALQSEAYFFAKYYNYSGLIYAYDEFLSFDLGVFSNLNDKSSIIIASVNNTIANGLKVTFMTAFLTGKADDEYSIHKTGEYFALARIEGRF